MIRQSVCCSMLLLPLLFTQAGFGQLTPAQRQQEMIQLIQLYNRSYGPYEWKRELFNFEMLNARPWLTRAAAARSDADFVEVLHDYTASLRDGHVFINQPATFSVSLPISVDLYDGKVLIESVNRTRLPIATYPFTRGDEIVTFDGKEVEKALDELAVSAYQKGAPQALRRSSADYLVFRPQSRFPKAHLLPATAKVGIRLAETGEVREFEITWVRNGEPAEDFGKLPDLMMSGKPASRQSAASEPRLPLDEQSPAWMADFLRLNNASAPSFGAEALPVEDREFHGVLGYGSLAPVWQFPAGFTVRVGRLVSDNFVSGWYTAGGKRIGYIRFGRMTPTTTIPLALQQLDEEVQWMQANTDGLVVDVMRNTGGFIVYGHELARRFIPYPFEGVGFEMRASSQIAQSFASNLVSARNQNAPDWFIAMLSRIYEDVKTANRENRGRTGSLPIDNYSLEWFPATDAAGRNIAYTKPMIVLVDEFSVSTADLFPAVMQDAARCKLVGVRTGGLGGTNTSFTAGAITNITAGVTLGLMVRPKEQNLPGFPRTRYIENVGVHPDVPLNYMTRENLMLNGAPFVAAFTEILLRELN